MKGLLLAPTLLVLAWSQDPAAAQEDDEGRRSTHFLANLPWSAETEEGPAQPAEPEVARPDATVAEGTPDFARDVRPILAEACFDCHGPDAAVRQADLRLDDEAGLFGDRGGYAAVVPADLDGSELWARITDADDPMPPATHVRQLTDADRDVLRRWIEGGAPFASHWAFEPVASVEPPAVTDEAWVRNGIDRFVLAELEARGIQPAPAADEIDLLRRVTLDLTGLPPTADELDAWLADPSDEAYEAVIDRLLATERYAESQAREWLDLARYADTNGDGSDGRRQMWRWRNWVIDSFHANQPYDEFLTEQVAGDLLPEATLEQTLATGFLRNHPIFTKPGVLEDEYRHAYVVDRVNTVGTAFLGLTVGCAQCHDHKYDPLSQREYFGLFAFFNNASERDVGRGFGNTRPLLHLPVGEDGPRLEELERRIAELHVELEGPNEDWDAAFEAWCARHLEAGQPEHGWQVLEPTSMMSLGGAELSLEDDGSIISQGWNPGSDTYNVIVRPGKSKIEALRLETLPDARNARGGAGRSERGTFSLGEIEVYVTTEASGTRGDRVTFARGVDDASIERGSTADNLVDGDGGDGWSLLAEESTEAHEAVLIPDDPIELNDSSVLRLVFQHGGSFRSTRSTLGRFRISFSEDEALRQRFLPVDLGVWNAVGPFPAVDRDAAYSTAFDPEEEIEEGIDTDKTYKKPKLPKKPRKGDEEADKPDARKPSGEEAGSSRKGEPEMKAKPGAKVIGKPAGDDAAARPDDDDRRDDEDEDDEERAEESEDEGPPMFGNFGQRRRGRDPSTLRWEEKPEWRDGSSFQLSGSNSAWFLMRKLEVPEDTTHQVRVWIDGGDALVAWLDGEEVHRRELWPEAPKEEEDGLATSTASAFGSFFGPSDPDFDPDPKDPDARSRRAPDYGDAFTLTLEAGEHELVLKVVSERNARCRVRTDLLGEDALNLAAARALGELDLELQGPTRALPRALATAEARPGKQVAKLVEDEPVKEILSEPEWASVMLPDPVARRRTELQRFFRERNLPELEDRLVERARARAERLRIYGRAPNVMVMNDDRPRTTRLLVRGAWDQPGEVVTAHTPAALPPLEAEGTPDRLDLARWMTSPDHPLTARVAVDRFWTQHFGRGLVRSPGDFGTRGEAPTHPALLDWLARSFVEGGWDVKALHKRIVMSATYRQSSTARPELDALDPEGRLYARMPRLRLAAEEVRDNALAVSGLLVEKKGGPSVRPYQPPGLWDTIGKGSGSYRTSKGDDLYRRGLYVYWRRAVLYPSFALFDAPNRAVCTVERVETNTPLQALVLLNDPVFVEAGRELGLRMREEGGVNDGARLAYGYRLATSRSPERAEMKVLLRVLKEQRDYWAEHSKEARRFVKVGSKRPPKEMDEEEVATWATVGQMLLNLDAVLHRN